LEGSLIALVAEGASYERPGVEVIGGVVLVVAAEDLQRHRDCASYFLTTAHHPKMSFLDDM
jgi:hypothetical protein